MYALNKQADGHLQTVLFEGGMHNVASIFS